MGWTSASGEQGLQNWIGVFKAQLLHTLCVILGNLYLGPSFEKGILVPISWVVVKIKKKCLDTQRTEPCILQ